MAVLDGSAGLVTGLGTDPTRPAPLTQHADCPRTSGWGPWKGLGTELSRPTRGLPAGQARHSPSLENECLQDWNRCVRTPAMCWAPS